MKEGVMVVCRALFHLLYKSLAKVIRRHHHSSSFGMSVLFKLLFLGVSVVVAVNPCSDNSITLFNARCGIFI